MKFIKEYNSFNITSDFLLDVKQIFLDVSDMGFKIIVNEPSKSLKYPKIFLNLKKLFLDEFNVVIFCESNLQGEYVEFDFEVIRNCILHVCSITNLNPVIYHGYDDDCPGEPPTPPDLVDINSDSIYMGYGFYIQIFFKKL